LPHVGPAALDEIQPIWMARESQLQRAINIVATAVTVDETL